MNTGIYKISIDDYFYIGQSQDLKTRERKHLYNLKKGTHDNRIMQNVYNKKKKFTFNLIIPCEIEELNRWEQTLLDFNQGNKLCMNICKDAEAPRRGLNHSKETKRKLSEANKGEKNPMYGKKFSEEHKRKISESQKGEKNHMYGKHRSEETKKKISEAKQNKTLHTFTHEEHGEITCTQYDLRMKYNLNQGHISEVISGKRKTHKGWRKK